MEITDNKSLADFAAEILKRRQARLEEKIRLWPRKNVIASDIPICTRQGFYGVHDWDKRKLHNAVLQSRFDKGNQEEDSLVRELGDLGFKVVEQQVPIEKSMTDTYRLTGKIDGKIVWNNRRVPFEVKSMNPNSFNRVQTLDDIKNDSFLSRYYRQIQVYLLGHNEPDGLLFLTNCMGAWKILAVELDYEESEKILKKVASINAYLDAGTLPDRIPYDPDICGFCSFAHICLPDVVNEAIVKWEDNPKVAKLLNRLDELKPPHKEYEELYEEFKAIFKGVPLAVVGKWTVTGKLSKRKSYDIPDDIKAKYVQSSETWLLKIMKADETNE